MNNDLLSQNDFDEIRDNLNDVMFTFFKRNITYKMDNNTATRWMKDIDVQRQYTHIQLNGLIVWNKEKTDQKETGAYDYNSGYCLVRYDDCLGTGIIDANTNPTVNPTQDKIVFNDIEYYIDAIIKIGQLSSKEVLVKILFRKELVN